MAKFDFVDNEPDLLSIALLDEHYKTKVGINLGSNCDIRPNLLNIDVVDFPDLDLRADINKIDDYLINGFAKEILAYDLLEHFPFADTTKILTKWINLLDKGGKIIVRVPDLQKLSKAILDNSLPIWEVQRLIYGGQDYPSNFHSAGFTGPMLEGYLLGCGCRHIIQVVHEPDTYNVTVVAVK